MSFVNSNSSLLCEDRFDREKKYFELYGGIIKSAFLLTKDLISNVKGVLLREKTIKKVEKNCKSHQLAYLLLHGVHDSCWSEENFHESFKECRGFIEELSSKKQIEIVCMGSESLFAAIGICKIIDEAVVQFGYLGDHPTEIQVSVIDDNKRYTWKNLCDCVIKKANFYYKGVELKLYYERKKFAYISGEDPLISKCHVVIMAKFLSQYRGECDVVLKKILQGMQGGSILFYLDKLNRGLQALLKYLTLEQGSFIEMGNFKEKYASFDNEKCEQYCLDFPFTWETHFMPVVSSTWKKCSEKKVVIAEKADIPTSATQTIESRSKNEGNASSEKETKPKAKTQKSSKGSGEQTIRTASTTKVSAQKTQKRSRSSKNQPNSRKENVVEEIFPTKSKSSLDKNKSSKNPLPVRANGQIKLVGKFASMDLEKRYKDRSHRQKAKEMSASRYADFDF